MLHMNARSPTGYLGVCKTKNPSKPYQAQITILGKKVFLGCFATAGEAALSISRRRSTD